MDGNSTKWNFIPSGYMHIEDKNIVDGWKFEKWNSIPVFSAFISADASTHAHIAQQYAHFLRIVRVN